MRRSLAFILPCALYAASAYRDVMYWDVGEMDTVPYILGIAHPPGMPLYTLIGWAFTHVFPFGSVAFRMSLLSALAMAATAWVLAAFVADETGDDDSATAAAVLFACGGVAWAHATRAEVHAFVILAFATVLLMLVRWYRGGRPRDFYAAMAAFGCGVAIHPIVAFAVAGVLAAVIARADETDVRVLVRGAAVTVAIVAVAFAYLPLRSGWIDAHALDPLRAYGMNGSAFWNYDDPSTLDGFTSLVTGRDVGVGADHFGATNAAFTMGIARFVRVMVAEFTLPGLVLAFAGIVLLFRRNIAIATIALATMLPSVLFGCGFGAESDVERYFLPAFVVLAIGAGVACAAAGRRRIAAIAITYAIAIVLVVTQRQFFHQPFDDRAAVEAAEVVRATPPRAIVVATWVLAPALAYDAYVTHTTGERVIVPAWYGDVEDELGGWQRSRPVFVAGTPEGSVTGFHLERMPTTTELYRVVRDVPLP